ncbi:MAG: propionyl-CoA synthetase, partial [Pseudomonadota bacterium]
VLASHPAVAECATFGVNDSLKGELPLGLVVLKAGADIEEEQLRQELVQLVRSQIGAVAAFKLVTVAKRLPKTRSGKILRRTMRQIADGEEYKVPPTIDDPAILQEITSSLDTLGYPHAHH